jgi:DNA-dependent RNA polymerase auxiliary subunit epsilon
MKRSIFYAQKSLLMFLVVSISCIILSQYVSADVFSGGNTNSDKFTLVDRTKVQNQIILLVNSVNSQKVDIILNMIHKDARPQLKMEMINSLKDRQLNYEQTVKKFSLDGSDTVRVEGLLYATVDGESISDREVYFIFKKYGNNWLIYDTDFHKTFSQSQINYAVSKGFDRFLNGAIPILILLELFWIWMIIDVSRRQLQDKTLWIVIVCALNVIGAGAYFFTVRRKSKEQEQLQGVLYPSQQKPSQAAPSAAQSGQSTSSPQVPSQYKREQISPDKQNPGQGK